jgi:hypothetical protein
MELIKTEESEKINGEHRGAASPQYLQRLDSSRIKGTICSKISRVLATLRGDAAAGRIMERLSDTPKARAMASEVISFYGDRLRYQESPVLPSSLFEIRLQHYPIGLECARIGLRLGTGRTAEALSHELLHLRLAMLGYPMGELVRIPRGMIPYADHLMGMHAIVGNLLHHELIFEAFLDLGFKEDQFLSPESPPDYEALIPRLLLFWGGYAAELEFPWWCVEYFGHWLSMRHGHKKRSGIYADDAIRWASRHHPEIAEVTDGMRKIVESGKLRDVGEYPHLVNRLLKLMRIPRYTRWVNIIPGRHGLPTAVKA